MRANTRRHQKHFSLERTPTLSEEVVVPYQRNVKQADETNNTRDPNPYHILTSSYQARYRALEPLGDLGDQSRDTARMDAFDF